jgi:hypothetical protein
MRNRITLREKRSLTRVELTKFNNGYGTVSKGVLEKILKIIVKNAL